MAAGEIVRLDDVHLTLGTTDVSAFVRQAHLMIEHDEVTSPPTFGRKYEVTQVADSYRWSLTVAFSTDSFDAGDVDASVTALMPAPLGASTSGGIGAFVARPDSAAISTENPQYSGSVAISSWEPLGSGQRGEEVTQTRTFRGAGALVKATS